MTANDAIAQCNDVLAILADGIDEDTWNEAPDFFESVEASLKAVHETIARNGHVTKKQATAIANWESGVLKWIHD